MDICIQPAPLSGSVSAPPSKSEAHRLLICAALADAPTEIRIQSLSNDIFATLNCLEALGAKIERGSGFAVVSPADFGGSAALNCGESGSTLRFLLPVAAALRKRAEFRGAGRLPERPIGALAEQMKLHGCVFSSERLPFTVSGEFSGGDFAVDGAISSQFITGLLLAAPLLRGRTRVRVTGGLQSADYVEMTANVMEKFGVVVNKEDGAFCVDEGARYRSAGRVSVGGDWSNAAFFLCAGAIGGGVEVDGLSKTSSQGDRRIVELLKNFGANAVEKKESVKITPNALRAQNIDVSQIPDLFPALAVVAACAEGKSTLFNAARLRAKESDRIDSTAKMLAALGICAEQTSDSLTITGGELRGGAVNAMNDHRIAMAAAIASVRAKNTVIIRGAEAVNKSYSDFFERFNSLGGKADVVSNRQSD